MSRLSTTIATIALMLLPLPASATQFSGLSVGLGASAFSLELESEFDALGSSSATTDKAGGMVDLGYGFLASRSVHLQAGVRGYPIEMEANLYDDDCVKIDQHVAAYGQVGYLFNDRNMLYGILEAGQADVTVHTEGYPDRDFEPSTFAFGAGYKHALGSHVEFFVEGMSRAYDTMAIHYVGNGSTPESGDYDGAKKDIDLSSTNVTAGFQLRF